MDNIMDYYEIRADGSIYSHKTKRDLVQYPCGSGYNKVTLRTKDGMSKNYMVHRLVALKFIPLVASKNQVNHIDGSKLNNVASNLEWVTNQENRDHAFRCGLIPTTEFEKGSSVGSLNSAAKLNEEMVIKLRKLGLKFKEFVNSGMNDTLKLTKACYNQMMRSYTWKHV